MIPAASELVDTYVTWTLQNVSSTCVRHLGKSSMGFVSDILVERVSNTKFIPEQCKKK